jgi:NADPH:quinone reductase-like Zn-dependent oxidoreductase
MKAAVLTNYGDPVTSLEYRDVPEPEKPGAGQVLVGVEFAPINFSDILVARGLYALRPDLPSVIGNEGVGRVLEIGRQVTDLRVGARVALPLGRFVWRERVVLPAADLIALPEDADPRQLAMVSINPPSAYLLLEEFLELHQGDWIALNAANSSIARWIVGFAKKKGLRIVGLARRAEVLESLRAAGCDLSLLDGDTAPSEMAAALGKVRPRLALDAVGGDASGRLTKLLGQGGVFVSYANETFTPMAISPFEVIFNDLTIRGFSLGNPAFAAQIPIAIREAAEMIAAGEVSVPIAATYPLNEIKAAITHALRGGKVLLKVDGALVDARKTAQQLSSVGHTFERGA